MCKGEDILAFFFFSTESFLTLISSRVTKLRPVCAVGDHGLELSGPARSLFACRDTDKTVSGCFFPQCLEINSVRSEVVGNQVLSEHGEI